MSDMAFAIHLGGGLHMDSDGKLHQGVPPSVPVYDPGTTLPLDPTAVKKALEGTQAAMKAITDDKVRKKFEELGLDTDWIGILSMVGKIAGMIAPVFAVAAFAFDIAKVLGLLKSGPDPLELLVNRRFDDVERGLHGTVQILNAQRISDGRTGVDELLAAVWTYSERLKDLNPSPAELEDDRNNLLGTYGQHKSTILTLFNTSTWLALFKEEEFKVVWKWMQGILYTHPGRASAPPAKVSFPANLAPVFDHRLMVPLVSYAAHGYLTSIRTMMPEYRTTGEFREEIKQFAKKLDQLAAEMRELVLARTIYKPEHFAWPVYLWRWEVENDNSLGTVSESKLKISRRCSRWPVGAMDLRHHNDMFFSPFLRSLAGAEVHSQPHRTKHAGMDFRWIPPARLRRSGRDPVSGWLYSITNPDECAAAANAQSEKDYADLLSRSGYFELLQLAALFRNEATAPNKSQTVTERGTHLSRRPLPSTTVTVESKPNFMSETIRSSAERQPQEYRAWVRATTQPIKRARPLEYIISLRTLASISTYHGGTQPRMYWAGSTYDDYQRFSYEEDLSGPSGSREHRFLKLIVTHQKYAVLGEQKVHEGTNPREDAVRKEGTLQMPAHTFDWWIPVKSPFSVGGDHAQIGAALRALGWIGPAASNVNLAQPEPVSSQFFSRTDLWHPEVITAAEFNPVWLEGWENGARNWKGEHRDVKSTTVEIGYTLDWKADRLSITLTNRPSDRNYIVYVVIEEKLIGTGQVLHTALPVAMNGQLTFIPQEFFDREHEAIRKFEQTMHDFNDKYSKSKDIGPLDPVVGWARPGHVISQVGLEQIAVRAQQHQPEMLQRVMQEHGYEDLDETLSAIPPAVSPQAHETPTAESTPTSSDQETASEEDDR